LLDAVEHAIQFLQVSRAPWKKQLLGVQTPAAVFAGHCEQAPR
jgi:hypothetical protein